MKHLLLLLLISQFLFSNTSSSVFPDNKILEEKKEYQEVILNDLKSSKTLYLSYLEYPNFVYQKQRFEINIKTIVARDKFDKLEVRFLDSKDIIILNPQSKWIEEKDHEYKNKFYIKALSSEFIMPRIQVLLYLNDKVDEIVYLPALNIKFENLGLGNKKFSNVMAKELKVLNYKTKQYNNKELLTVLEISALNANLEDFILSSSYKEQGQTSFKENYPSQDLIYHVIIPIHTKKISFDYYNTSTKSFENISLKIHLENDLVSTQTDLNPSNSNFEFYKKIALAVLAFIFLLITIWKRKIIFLIFTLILLILLIIYIMPNKTIILAKDIVIYILPTKNSTVFFKTNKKEVVEILNQKSGFYKVLFKNNDSEIIGWIKEKDVIKN